MGSSIPFHSFSINMFASSGEKIVESVGNLIFSVLVLSIDKRFKEFNVQNVRSFKLYVSLNGSQSIRKVCLSRWIDSSVSLNRSP